MRKTKIVCTLGPATDNEEVLREMMLSGMNVARVNFSHHFDLFFGKLTLPLSDGGETAVALAAKNAARTSTTAGTAMRAGGDRQRRNSAKSLGRHVGNYIGNKDVGAVFFIYQEGGVTLDA